MIFKNLLCLAVTGLLDAAGYVKPDIWKTNKFSLNRKYDFLGICTDPMVPLVFRFNHFQGISIFRFFSKKTTVLMLMGHPVLFLFLTSDHNLILMVWEGKMIM
jgi:hypothetical protein